MVNTVIWEYNKVKLFMDYDFSDMLFVLWYREGITTLCVGGGSLRWDNSRIVDEIISAFEAIGAMI